MSPAAVSPGADLPPTRASLLVRLRDWEDQQSWEEFYQIYEKLIYETAVKSGLQPVEAQEVLQETLLAVAKRIAGFRYDPGTGSFRNWLLKITRRRIIDQFRKRRPQHEALPGDGALSAPLDQLSDPGGSRLEAVWNEEWHQALLDMARSLVKRRVAPRHYRMFELYVIGQQPMKIVTKSLGVSPAQVYMAKYRITQLLRKELKRLQAKML